MATIHTHTNSVECIWRPFDIAPQPEGPEMDQQVITVRNRLQGLGEFWVEYYRMSASSISADSRQSWSGP